MHLGSFFKPTPHFIYSILSFRVRHTCTHPHTHTTLKPMSKTGRRLGRDPNHPTRPAGTLVRKTRYSIISRRKWPGKHIIQSYPCQDMTRKTHHPIGPRRVPTRKTQTQSRDSSTPDPTSSQKTPTHTKNWLAGHTVWKSVISQVSTHKLVNYNFSSFNVNISSLTS